MIYLYIILIFLSILLVKNYLMPFSMLLNKVFHLLIQNLLFPLLIIKLYQMVLKNYKLILIFMYNLFNLNIKQLNQLIVIIYYILFNLIFFIHIMHLLKFLIYNLHLISFLNYSLIFLLLNNK